MLQSFKEQTREISDHEEAVLVPLIINELKTRTGRSKAIKNAELIALCYNAGNTNKIQPARLRKMIEHIRQNNLLPGVVGHASGYYVAQTPEELKEWIETMIGRRNAIKLSIDAGFTVYKKMTGKNFQQQYLFQ
jgi:hypothetical protein